MDHSFDVPDRPQRVVSLTSGATEALFAIQCGDCVAGVSDMRQRDWTDLIDVPVIESTIRCGRNVIHDGPSCVETSAWLKGQVCAARV